MLLAYTFPGYDQIMEEEFGKLPGVRLTKIQAKSHVILPYRIAQSVSHLQEDLPSPNDSIILIWSRYHILALSQLIGQIPRLGIDELWFPHLDMELDIGWAVGRANALIKWGATCMDAYTLKEKPWPEIKSTMSETALLVWWAQRINLKVFGLVT